ncbi:universal stress protein [Planococcus sp. ISL-110]|uniref:universal stress protein n=1 Tax=Planococcus sp. ISL-110 TaxID=2819167 RepID=UPI001BE85D38|nr:universal stress protein [Planococcus sp. ISL-110]MBT2569069.1 universal stress protein [Planococcus sp. ISL-110]
MTTKLLLASDGSHHAHRAAEEAIKLAKINESEIIIAYVSSDDSDNKGEVHPDIQNKLQETQNLIKQASLTYQVKVLHGDPADAISDYANANAFEFLVIGSRGLNKMQEMVMGSVSYEVMKLAKCPVLVVK